MIDEKQRQQQIESLMKKLHITEEEAIEVMEYDDNVNKGKKTAYDLTPEQKKNVQEMARKTEHKKRSSIARQRKPDDVKEAIMLALADFLENECEMMIKDELIYCDSVEITNKTRLLHFKVGEREYDLQLIGKRATKNANYKPE